MRFTTYWCTTLDFKMRLTTYWCTASDFGTGCGSIVTWKTKSVSQAVCHLTTPSNAHWDKHDPSCKMTSCLKYLQYRVAKKRRNSASKSVSKKYVIYINVWRHSIFFCGSPAGWIHQKNINKHKSAASKKRIDLPKKRMGVWFGPVPGKGIVGHQAATWFACPTVHSLIVQLQVTQADHPNTEL